MKYTAVFGAIEFGKAKIGENISPTYLGGNAIVASLAIAKHVPVYLIGVVGTDLDLQFLKDTVGENISIENVEQYEGKTFKYFGVYDPSTFKLKEHEVEFNVYAQYKPRVICEKVKEAHNIFFSGSNPFYGLQILRQLSNPEVIGVCTMLYHLENNYDSSVELLKKATYIFSNRDEFNFLKNKIGDIFSLSKNLQYVFVTDGEKGVTLYSKESDVSISFEKTIIPLDPTNAGDVFAGTIMGMLVNGYSLPRDMKYIIENAHIEAMKVILNDPYYRKIIKEAI